MRLRLIYLVTMLVSAICFFSHSIFADTKDTKSAKDDDYYADYLEDEGRLLFKIRGYGVLTEGKQTNFSKTPTVTNPQSPGKTMLNGFGVETAATIFFTDHIGLEGSLGVQRLKLKNAAFNTVAQNYGSSATLSKSRYLYVMPFSLSAQFHIAPFGGVRPYVGGGYHVAYMLNRVKQVTFKTGHGPLLQVGVDLVAKDDTIITVDVRQYFLKPQLKYRDSFSGVSGLKAKSKMNPLIISAGVGVKF